MVVKDLHIQKYDWNLRVYYAVTCYHTNDILNDLVSIDCPDHILKRVYKNLQKRDMDSGFTYSNHRLHETVMVIGLFSSPAQFLNSLEHEVRHMADDIASTYWMDPGGEDVAYMTGDINELLIKEVQQFICDCPCHRR